MIFISHKIYLRATIQALLTITQRQHTHLLHTIPTPQERFILDHKEDSITSIATGTKRMLKILLPGNMI